jgi:hypothetical protein
MKKINLLIILTLLFNTVLSAQTEKVKGGAVVIGSNLQLFVDSFIIDKMDNLHLKMQTPVDEGEVMDLENPWEGPFAAYFTILKDGDLFRLYYRGEPGLVKDGSEEEVICYAESKDGIHWTKPDLNLFEVNGSKKNNVVLAHAAPVTHNFSPFIDTRPGVDPAQKYKAVGGLEKTGLVAYVSPDGIHWTKLQDEPLIGPRPHDFDSQNVIFWSEAEQQYVCYFRSWVKYDKRYRSVARATSKDFIHWTEPKHMDYGDTPPEQLYTNQTSPYYRAPHIYISIGARFMKNRQVLTEEEAKALNVNPKYFKDCSDAVFMSTRGDYRYHRTFLESFIRPGIGLDNWVSRSNYPALNVIQTGDTEMSVYLNQDYAQPTAHLHRYSLRIDGFVSVNAPYAGGEIVTKPLIFTGDEMVMNFSTSAAGYVKVELQDEDGNPIPGFELEKSKEIIGNEIEKKITWQDNPDLKALNGKPVRVRFVMKDADLYSFKFK